MCSLTICGESCFKYSADFLKFICRHGFYHITMLQAGNRTEGHWKQRRRGKPLRNTLFVKETDHGMQGRLLHIQEHPFECLSNYGGIAAIRCNPDVQKFRIYGGSCLKIIGCREGSRCRTSGTGQMWGA